MKLGKWFLKITVALIVLLVAVQIGIHEGRRMERADCEQYPLPVINALLRTDGYGGRLAYRKGSLRIIYSLAEMKAARDLRTEEK